MRTRTIVALVVAGVALLVLPGMGIWSADDSAPASGQNQAEPVTAEAPEPAATVGEPVARPTTSTVPVAGPTTSTVPPTTVAPEIEGRAMGSPLGQRWPLTEALPKDARGWRIDFRVEGDQLVLTVTLRAVLNRADQLDAYRASLRAYKAEVLDWLGSQGAEAGTYVMEWRPPEAAAL